MHLDTPRSNTSRFRSRQAEAARRLKVARGKVAEKREVRVKNLGRKKREGEMMEGRSQAGTNLQTRAAPATSLR